MVRPLQYLLFLCTLPLALVSCVSRSGFRDESALEEACVSNERCGPECAPCSGDAPQCGGAEIGCICNETSCDVAQWCDGVACQPCDTSEHCGPTCSSCLGTTPTCAGVETGCVCDGTGSCPGGTYCDGVACQPCDTSEHCGPACSSCLGTTPTCAGVETGCVCDGTGSCSAGTYCDGGFCAVCDSASRCGPECVPCTGETPDCGGGETGCVCNETSCGSGHWCDGVACQPCDTREHCGPGCLSCPASLPICDQAATGCVCDVASCGSGAFCDGTSCQPCDLDTMCGPSCEDCTVSSRLCATDGSGCEFPSDCTGLADFTACSLVTSPDYDYDICLDEVCVAPGCGEMVSNAPWPTTDVPDTSQTQCYDDTQPMACNPLGSCSGASSFCGQDAQYGWDLSHVPAERYSRESPVLGEPVVTDAITSLMWQGCALQPSGDDCGTDPATQYTWQQAIDACEGSSWGGYSDWRLPSALELFSIVELSNTPPAPALNQTAFPNSPGDQHWSIDTALTTDGADYSWAAQVDFANGELCASPKVDVLFVRCVRNP